MPSAMYQLQRVVEPTSLSDHIEGGTDFLMVLGHLGQDPDVRTTAGGIRLCRGSLAVSWGKRGEDQKTEWIRFVAWRESCEALSGMLKGDAVLLIGKIQRQSFTGRDGEPRTSEELNVWSVALPVWRRASGPKSPPQGTSPASKDDDGDDIPF